MDRVLMALFAAFMLALGLTLAARYWHTSGRQRSRSEADIRLDALFAEEEDDEIVFSDSEAKERFKKERRSIQQRLAVWLASLRYFSSDGGEGRNVIASVDRHLTMAGMRTERFGPYQAMAATLLIWAAAIILPALAYVEGMPIWTTGPLCVLGFLFPIMKVRRAKTQRRLSIQREVPRFIRQLSMALSSQEVTLPDAIERVVRSNTNSGRVSPLTEEFGRAYAEFRHGRVSLESALQGIPERTGVPAVDNFVTSLVAAHQTGSDIRSTLKGAGKQAQEMFKQATREKIAKSETKFIFSLAFTFFGAIPLYLAPMVLSMLSGLNG